MNLEKLNVTELNAQEKVSIDGGDWWDATCAVAEFMIDTVIDGAIAAGVAVLGFCTGIVDGLEEALND
jgi:hypothetical protein